MHTHILAAASIQCVYVFCVPGSTCRLLGTTQQHTLYFLVEAKSRVREVYAQTCLHFAKQGMLDTELFGLAILIGECGWVVVGGSKSEEKKTTKTTDHTSQSNYTRIHKAHTHTHLPRAANMLEHTFSQTTKRDRAVIPHVHIYISSMRECRLYTHTHTLHILHKFHEVERLFMIIVAHYNVVFFSLFFGSLLRPVGRSVDRTDRPTDRRPSTVAQSWSGFVSCRTSARVCVHGFRHIPFVRARARASSRERSAHAHTHIM